MPIFNEKKDGARELRITKSEASIIAGREVSKAESQKIQSAKDAMMFWLDNNDSEVSILVHELQKTNILEELKARFKTDE